MPEHPPTKLDALTSLRFFAAGMIVLHHLAGSFGIPEDAWLPFVLDQAVSFFFVLSGFILTYAYPELASWEARGRFWLARFARIWPAHAAAFVLVLVVLGDAECAGRGAPESAALALLNLSLLQAWLPFERVFFSFNSVSWSISTEFGFYLLFPLLIPRFRRTWWWKLALSFALVLATAWLSSWLELPRVATGATLQATSPGLMYVNPLARLFEFVLGMSASLALPRARALLRGGGAFASALEIGALVLLVWNAARTAAFVHVAVHDGWISEPLGLWMVHGGATCLSFALVVLVFACQAGWPSRILAARPLVLLGEISFSLYLLHQILLRAYWHFEGGLAALSTSLRLGVFLALVLLLSHLLWAAVERPLRARIRSLWLDPGRARTRGASRARPRAQPGALAALLDPGARIVIAELALLVLIGVPLAVQARRPAPPPPGLAREAVQRYREATPQELRDVRFGRAYALRAARVQAAPDAGDGLVFEAVWEPLREPRVHMRVALHLVDPDGEILAYGPYERMDASWVPGGRYLERRSFASWPERASHLAVSLKPEGEAVLYVDRGERDWQGYRLLLPLPDRRAPGPGR